MTHINVGEAKIGVDLLSDDVGEAASKAIAGAAIGHVGAILVVGACSALCAPAMVIGAGYGLYRYFSGKRQKQTS
jgi:hypothetical protein